MRLEFFFDTVSPYSYLAAVRIPALESATGVQVCWRPFFLGGLFRSIGHRAPRELPARERYLWADLARLSRFHGIPLTLPETFPFNSLTAQRALVSVDETQCGPLALRVFKARWEEGRPIDDGAVLEELVGPETVSAATSDNAKARLKANTDEAAARGAFGAPSFFLDDALYFGSDRMDVLQADILQRLS